MRRLLLATTALIVLSSPVMAQGSPYCDHYAGHVDVEGKFGGTRNIGETSAFVPVACSEDKLLFSDIRFKGDNTGNREANLALGVRSLREAGVLGGYVYFDRRESGYTEKMHSQITAGADWLSENFEARTNAYIPLTGDKLAAKRLAQPVSTSLSLQGSGIFVSALNAQVVEEQVLWGTDAEAGFKIPGTDFWLHAGGFSFHGDDVDLNGVRGRATYQITENIALTAEGQRDNVRGRMGWVGVRFTVPFGGPDEKPAGLKTRMTASPVRDVDIVTVPKVVGFTSLDDPVAVTNTDSGTAQRVIYVDNTASAGGTGTKESPFNTLAAAQAALQDNDVLYIETGVGTAGMDKGIIIAKNNVKLIGAGTDFVYDGSSFGNTTGQNFNGIILKAASIAPMITNDTPNADPANNQTIGNAVLVTSNNVLVAGINASNATNTGVRFFASGAGAHITSGSVDHVTASNNTRKGIYFYAHNGGVIDNVSVTNSAATGNLLQGIHAQANINATIGNIVIKDNISNGNKGANGQGITVSAHNSSAITTALVESNNTSQNENIGMFLYSNGGNSSISTTTIKNLTSNNNINNGSGIHVGLDPGTTMGTVNLENITANGNLSGTATGVNIVNVNGTLTNLNLKNITAHTNNTFGLHIQAQGIAPTTATLDNINVQGNNQYGTYIRTLGAGNITTTIKNSTMVANRQDGIAILHNSVGGGSGFSLDLGDATIAGTGNNSIYGNGLQNTAVYKDILLDINNGTLKAENNWWGADADPTVSGQVRVVDGANGGTVDATPRLSTAP